MHRGTSTWSVTSRHPLSRSSKRRQWAKRREIKNGRRTCDRDQRDINSELHDAIRQGLARANQTLRNVKSAWIKEQQVWMEDGSITEYQVNMLVTFVLDD
jgi:flavin-binding protein dodecin